MLGSLLETHKRYNPREVEKQVAEWWSRNDIIKKTFEKNKEAPVFSFLEGPPTVNGYMHIGHVRGRVYKDIVLRYMSMKGLNVWRRAGWDCQGLPTEIEVEKRLNITSKKDLEKIGLERFVEEANKVVDYYISKWREASEKLALWLDYDTAYETRKEEYMEHIWYFLKRCYEEGKLVESLRVVPYCPRCETPLSQHELAQGYEEVEDPSIYVKIQLKDNPTKFIIIWTTTPWTIPGNEAVAVNPNEQYIEIKVNNETWILAEKLLDKFIEETKLSKFKKEKIMLGKELVGLHYVHPLYDEVPEHQRHDKNSHTVIPSEYVSMEEGTGCVHTAPAHGPEDFELGRKHNLPIFCPVSSTGKFKEDGGKYTGLSTREASITIVEDLRKKNLLVKAGTIKHNYPLCWRCNTPLIYLASTQWFLRVEPIKDTMLQENENVKWWPEWAGTNRFGEWLKNADDWCISRTKVWGTPLNIWICSDCGEKKAIGSRAELKEAVEKPNEIRMHRPWVDRIVFKCSKCGGKMYRVPFVLDTWLDSGVAHFASINYLNDNKLFNTLFPYDFITEAIDQTRGWFYTLLFTSCMIFNKTPFKSVLTQGHVLDEFGKKMSKSRGNVIWALDAFERYGVDTIRFYLVSKAEPWSTINFVPKEVMQTMEHLNILWNVFSFAKTYFNLDRFEPGRYSISMFERDLKPEDRWILSRVNSLTRIVSTALDNMEIQDAARELRWFVVEDLSRTYVRAIRRRVWTEAETKDKLTAYTTLYYVLKRLTILLAPFTPYLAEALYHEIKINEDPESVHLVNWPRVDERLIDDELEDAMVISLDVVATSLAARQKGGRKLRWPVVHTIIAPKNQKAKKSLEQLKDFIASMTNSQRITVLETGQTPDFLKPEIKLNLKTLGPKLGNRLNRVKQLIEKMKAEEIVKEMEDRNSLTLKHDGEEIILNPEDLIVEYVTPPHIVVMEGKFAHVYIDMTETEEIKAASIANEIIRRIQVMRKDIGLEMMTIVSCVISIHDEDTRRKLSNILDYIEEETRTKIQIQTDISVDSTKYYVKNWQIDKLKIVIGLQKQ